MDIHIQEPSVEINFNFSGKISLISNYWAILGKFIFSFEGNCQTIFQGGHTISHFY